MVKIRWSLLSIAICSTLLVSACSAKEASTPETKRTAIKVEVASVSIESLDTISNVSGTLLPYEEALVSFEVGGRIQNMKAEIGDTVKAGAILANLNSADFGLQVEQAESSVLQAEASLISSYTSAKLAVGKAKDSYNKLKTDLNRLKILYEQGVVSKKEYEDLKLQVDNAQRDVVYAEESLSLLIEGATKEQRNQVLTGINEAQAGKVQLQAGIDQTVAAKGQEQAAYEQALAGKAQAELALSKTKLTSPLTGIVLEKLVSEGQQVNPGEVVYKLGRTDQLKVLLPIHDKDIKQWKLGNQVSVSLYDQVKTGKVNKIYPQTNAGTGTISVEVMIPNEKFEWVPGQVIKASHISSDKKGILVPIEAVISNGFGPYVYKEVKGHAVKTTVETGGIVNNKIHIISGLEEGDRVVVLGGELLTDGDLLETDGGKK